jgi:hypothetical protein
MGETHAGNGSGKHGKVKALRILCPATSYLCHAGNRPVKNAPELHPTIHFFAVLSRFITEIERAATLGFTDGFQVSRI